MQLSFKALKNHVPSVNVLKASALELLELAALLLLSLLLPSFFYRFGFCCGPLRLAHQSGAPVR